MKKTILVIGIIFSVIGKLLGQNDHLEPIEDTVSYPNSVREYYESVCSLLYDGLKTQPLVRYTVLPSFSEEYTLSFEKNTSGEHKMILRVLSENYWYADKKDQVGVFEKLIIVTPQFSNAVEELFKTAVDQIKKPDSPTIGMDGTNYYFSATNSAGKFVTGKKWTPEKGTKTEKLVSLCRELANIVFEKEINFEEVTLKIKKLTIELEEE